MKLPLVILRRRYDKSRDVCGWLIRQVARRPGDDGALDPVEHLDEPNPPL